MEDVQPPPPAAAFPGLSISETERLKPEIQNAGFFFEYDFTDNRYIIIEP